MTRRIDAHHHLWRYSEFEFGWLDSDYLTGLRRDFLIEEFRSEMQAARVHGCVAVQARQSLQETEWLLHIASQTPEILGVVGWADIAADDFDEVLQ